MMEPSAAEFAIDGFHQVPPDGRENWVHDFYSKFCGWVRFRHRETGKTVVCPNMWYNGTPESSIERREFWIEEGRKREAYWISQKDGWDKDYHLAHIRRQRQEHLEVIERIRHTGEVL